MLTVAGDVDFVLQDARGPGHANDVGGFRFAEANHNVGRVLPQISIRSGNLKFLPVASREHFHFGSDGTLVISQSLERETQPVILIRPFIAQQHRRAVILRDQQIGGAVVVVIACDDGARLFELNLVETNVCGYIFEAVRAQVAKQLGLALAFFRFSDGDEIDPAVVVVVESSDAVGAPNPVRLWKGRTLESLAPIVTPQRDALPVALGERDIHPAIMVKIKNRNASGRGRKRCRPNSLRDEFPFSWILENSRSAIREDDIYGTIIVIVAADYANSTR